MFWSRFLLLVLAVSTVNAIDCGCSSCTSAALAEGNGFCIRRIDYLMNTYGDSELQACEGASQYPDMPADQIGIRPCRYEACHPKGCTKKAAPAPTPPAPPKPAPVPAVAVAKPAPAAPAPAPKKDSNLRKEKPGSSSSTSLIGKVSSLSATVLMDIALAIFLLGYCIHNCWNNHMKKNKKVWEKNSPKKKGQRVGAGKKKSKGGWFS